MSSAQRKNFTHRERYELHWSRFCVLTAALINDDRDNESIRIALALMSGIFRGKFGSLLRRRILQPPPAPHAAMGAASTSQPWLFPCQHFTAVAIPLHRSCAASPTLLPAAGAVAVHSSAPRCRGHERLLCIYDAIWRRGGGGGGGGGRNGHEKR